MKNGFLNTVFVPSPGEIASESIWIEQQIKKIGEQKLAKLIKEAIKIRSKAYIPYSNYAVGASILCSSGKMYSAPNTEVVSYSQTGHAESNAINRAIAERETETGRKFIEALVVCHSGKSGPCGACRQEIIEHCDNALIIDVNPDGKPLATTSLKILLPFGFSPTHLGK